MSNRKRGRPRRFSRDEAREIRRLNRVEGQSFQALATQFNVGVGTLRRVIKGEGAYASTL